MIQLTARDLAIEALNAARSVADFASAQGALVEGARARPQAHHMGALVADAVLQSGLNYATVVKPRVITILHRFPGMDRVSALAELVARDGTAEFLGWRHSQKISRFNDLVEFLRWSSVEHVEDLCSKLTDLHFCQALQGINGIGPKTVDYMACLVGIDSIAVDRHVRMFAKRVGVERDDYQFLRAVFCSAADLLSIPRRDFDAWIWQKESSRTSVQLTLNFSCQASAPNHP